MSGINFERIMLALSAIKNAIFNLESTEYIKNNNFFYDDNSLFEKKKQISILSYNVWNSFFAGGPNRDHRLNYIIKNLIE